MRIGRPLLKLPVRFSEKHWHAKYGHFQPKRGCRTPSSSTAIRAFHWSARTAPWFTAPMGRWHRPWLRRSPYILEIMAALNATWGRSRLMGLAAGADVPDHVDMHYYWRTHLRIHIPVITNPDVGFTCNGQTIHMPAGECWILNSFYRHAVANRGRELRVHLVLDTVGSATCGTSSRLPTWAAPKRA